MDWFCEMQLNIGKNLNEPFVDFGYGSLGAFLWKSEGIGEKLVEQSIE